MQLDEYFLTQKGWGVLSTANARGAVDAALYTAPFVMDEHTIAFIMADKLTHRNLQENPHAVYVFVEEGREISGKRLYLKKTAEYTDQALIDNLRKRKAEWPVSQECDSEQRFLVYFQVDFDRPLVGGD